MKCNLCPLGKPRGVKIVQGEFYSTVKGGDPRVMVITEAPGEDENRSGRPMVGPSGSEARHHLDVNGISRFGVWLDHVCKCKPPGNRDLHADEIRICSTNYLLPQIFKIQPTHIITMGRNSTRWVLGDVDMEMVHGIPRPFTFVDFENEPLDTIIIPSFHPAAGLHSPELMLMFHTDMVVAGKVIKGEIAPHPPVDEWKGVEEYHLIGDEDPFPLDPDWYGVVSLDTEWARGKMWCLSFSVIPGEAFVVMEDQRDTLKRLNATLGKGNVTTIIHNALYDLPVLWAEDIFPAKPIDTMVMAYLLQNEPQGLKPLALRHCGMDMGSYSEQVAPYTRVKAMQYIKAAASLDWSKPEPVLEWRKGEPHVRQPQSMSVKLKRIMKGVENGDDPWDKWKAVKEGKEVVEEILGPLEEAELPDVPLKQAIWYSARDADATIRVYPILEERIRSLGLTDTLERDMRAMPMVVDMMRNGMPVRLDSFANLSVYLQGRMDEIQNEIQQRCGRLIEGRINPNSYPQMSSLIYDKLRLHEKGGRHKAKKSSGEKSTADDILKKYTPLHPVVQNIIDWRGYAKLKNSYADAIPKMVSPDGRIRTTLRMTRVVTGRLSSSSPNLMAQPNRSREGKMVRDCYETGEDRTFLSGDYSQVEMRIAASEAKDDKMLNIFWNGDDIHSITAAEMFGIPVGRVDEMKHRYPAKRVGFGILNLITAEGLHRELITGGSTIHTLDDCREMIKAWFEIYHGIAGYMKENGLHAKRFGYVRDMWGRIRYIPGIKSTNKWGRLEAERQAGNAPIQSGAQGVIKEAMGRLVPVYREYGGGLIPLIQIHDDIVWELDEGLANEVIPKIKNVMENAAAGRMMVPLEVDFKLGTKWGSMKKWEGGK